MGASPTVGSTLMVKRILVGTVVVALLAFAIWGSSGSRSRTNPLPVAIALLEQNGIPVPQHKIVPIDRAPERASQDVAAWVFEDSDTIFVMTTTPVWEGAAEGDEESLMNLASILVHEGVHADGNANEADAYTAQIVALEKMGASRPLIEGMENAKREHSLR